MRYLSLCVLLLFVALSPLLTGCQSGGLRPGAGAAPDLAPPDMLEKALPAVVTVAVYKTDAIGKIYGYARKADAAYSHPLNISDAQSSGSGFIVEKQGKKYVVTNAHVIDQATDEKGALAVFTITGRRYPARVIGADTFYDVAVLEFAGQGPGEEVASLTFSPREPRIGEQVFAIGNPLGAFPYTVTQGIIGGKNRVRGGPTGKFGYLQSSATTIWGNSGGPLIDAGGQVVGINSQIEIVSRPLGTFIQPQLNFALEAGIAERAVAEILTHGHLVRAFTGLIATQEFDPETGLMQGMSPRIAAVLPDSPAAPALGGREGSAITAVNGVKVRNIEELLGELERIRPGGNVRLTLENGGESVPVSFSAGALTAKLNGALASFFLKSFASLDPVAAGGDLLLRQAAGCLDGEREVPPCGRHALIGIYYPATDTTADLAEFPAAFTVRSGGFMLSAHAGDSRLWKTANLAELAMAIRTGALSGTVIFAGSLPEGEAVIALALTGNTGAMVKALLY
ncbi:MAG TPA: trypsin-like peptidase domain-containing protein [Geobacteraceae bacterium]